MDYKLPSRTIFYSIEKTIKVYRKFAQKNISERIGALTVDQSLVLQFLHKNSGLTQSELAKLLFKEDASITRMIESMVKNEFLIRSVDTNDRRKSIIKITNKGMDIMEDLEKVILSNRGKALSNITEDELLQLETILDKLATNCQSK